MKDERRNVLLFLLPRSYFIVPTSSFIVHRSSFIVPTSSFPPTDCRPLSIMKAMILAAGLGTRLYPLTEDRTKPAIPFLNRPLITYVVDYLAGLGIRDLIIN